MKKRITYVDIAKHTGLSKMTISRFFNNPNKVSETNKSIIQTALKDLNYKENKVAQILAKGKSEYIGVLLPELFFNYYPAMLKEILSTYSTYGFKFIVFSGNKNKALEKQYIQELISHQIEGLIVLSYTLSSKELQQFNIPIVGIEREDTHISSVNINNYEGGKLATQHLIDNKCDVLIHINGYVRQGVPSYKRIIGFTDTCKKNNTTYEVIQNHFIDDYHDTYTKFQNIFQYIEKKYPNKKVGCFVSNDTHANILTNILVKNRKNIPNHYSLVGFDNTISQEAIIPITSISQNAKKIAVTTVELLKQKIINQQNALEIKHLTVEPELVVRDTTNS